MDLDSFDEDLKVQALRIALEDCSVNFIVAEALSASKLVGAIVKTLIFEEAVLAVLLILSVCFLALLL